MYFSGCLLLALLAGVTAWKTCDPVFHDSIQTTKEKEYFRAEVYDLKAKQAAFVIQIKGCRNARIRLMTEADNLISPGYNLNIDTRNFPGWCTAMNVRSGTGFSMAHFAKHPKLLDCNEYRDIWVTWDYDARRLAIGTGTDPNSNEQGFHVYRGNELYDVRYVWLLLLALTL
ncbi:hypothetical protein CAPTEDRAFT_222242 [Capitella teleta]|uniref:Farnesoic acid O-methyl transferase domain-containing protein n=1 Tax=Capitella teleta TaxID=283909 RepID=R7UM50_CAPTE|nr:hypothetical protein CAPTEDRAFT_222242 [Capitella teleta]|eukprot:ELU05012.1 hypothetical protein CAPTEDRAFT_222242 [Capitella teleta]